MIPWFQYWFERLPVASYGLLSAGIALSSLAMSRQLNMNLDATAVMLAGFGVFYSLALLRLMDDLKDHAKDRLTHPKRPLARGLIQPEQAQKVVLGMNCLMIVASLWLYDKGHSMAGFYYAIIAIYQWLMFREFYCHKLSQYPIWYALSHQALLIPVSSFCFAMHGNTSTYHAFWFGIMMMGSFFCFEVCRKLKPHAPRVLGYYRTLYGLPIALLLAGLGCVIASWGSEECKLDFLTLPIEMAVAVILIYVWFRPDRYRLAEYAASISLLLHAWAGALAHFWH